MGKKKKKTKELKNYDFEKDMLMFEDEEDSFESEDDIFGFDKKFDNGGLNNMATTGVLETNPFMMRNNNLGSMGMGMGNLTQPDFKKIQRDNVINRIKDINITDKQIKKAKKKIESGNCETIKVVLKDGVEFTKKERKLLDKINILRVAQGDELIEVKESIDNNDKVKLLSDRYKVYKCSYLSVDSESVDLEFEDFCEYIKRHDIEELFLAKSEDIPLIKLESSIWNDVEYESIKKDVKTWNKILDKIETMISSYTFKCYVNNIAVSTKIDTHYGFSDFMHDEVFILHKEELLADDTFGSM